MSVKRMTKVKKETYNSRDKIYNSRDKVLCCFTSVSLHAQYEVLDRYDDLRPCIKKKNSSNSKYSQGCGWLVFPKLSVP